MNQHQRHQVPREFQQQSGGRIVPPRTEQAVGKPLTVAVPEAHFHGQSTLMYASQEAEGGAGFLVPILPGVLFRVQPAGPLREVGVARHDIQGFCSTA